MQSIAKAVAKAMLPARAMQALRARRSLSRGDNPELRLLPRWNGGGCFIDVGANIGDWSRIAARTYKTVHCFEPNPDLAAKLRDELPETVHVYDVALSDIAGQARLFIPTRNGREDTGLASLDPNANPVGPMRQVPVPVRTLDGYALGPVDCIKIDVEGLEERVLRGAMETIQRNKPVLIVEIEDRFHPDGTTRRVFDMIQAWGYRPHYLRADLIPLDPRAVASINHPDDGPMVNNFVFLPVS